MRDCVRKLAASPLALFGLVTIGVFVLAGIFSLFPGLSLDFATSVGTSYVKPSLEFWFGTDLLGRDVFAKTVHGAKVALTVGLVASLVAIPIGAVLGSIGGYFGGRIDECVVWLYSTFASVPQILLLTALGFVLGRGTSSIYIAVGLTSWVGTCRLIRGEVIKHRDRDYVAAARMVGAGHGKILFGHIFPNVAHLLIIDFSLRFIYAIKSEAVLSYLGLGVQGEPSWGVMIADAREELLQGVWWQLAAATGAMFLLVLAFHLVGDALRDALDPRLSE